MAFSRVISAQRSGLSATEVIVEVDIVRGMYAFQIVGLPDKAVMESRERVTSALRNSGIHNIKKHHQKITVALSPAEQKKEGTYFDVAIAIGYLIAFGALSLSPSGILFIGELSLNGTLQPVKGIFALLEWAKQNGFHTVYLPKANEYEVSNCSLGTMHCFLVPTLADLVFHLQQKQSAVTQASYYPQHVHENIPELFSLVRGQEAAKRALLITAIGEHNTVLWGPPGTGKSMLAQAMHNILPDLTDEAFIEVATIYSSIGRAHQTLSRRPPLRAPHHSASHTAIIGGGSTIHPGEVTLAHRGVLYMDELLEFNKKTIESLRQPLQDGEISLSRVGSHALFPARFMLLATVNPCPCGYKHSTMKHCVCTIKEINRYQKKLSGPIIDRIDIWIPMNTISYETMSSASELQSDSDVRLFVTQMRQRCLTQKKYVSPSRRNKKNNRALWKKIFFFFKSILKNTFRCSHHRMH